MTFEDGLFDTYTHGPGYWKLNVSLLKDTELVEGVEALWGVLKDSHVKNGVWWENCKLTFKRFLVRYSRRKAFKSKEQAQVLLAQVALFEELAVEDPPFFAGVLSTLKESLNSLAASKARGAQIRSRAFYLNMEEKPCSYFLRRESAGSKAKYIAELCDDSGCLFRDSLSLQRVCGDFFIRTCCLSTQLMIMSSKIFWSQSPLWRVMPAWCVRALFHMRSALRP